MNTRPWRPFYGDMPGEIEYPNSTLYDTLEQSVTANLRRPAYDFLGQRRSYRSLLGEVKRAARGLWGLGVRPGHRICTLLPNSPHTTVLLYAANRIGAVLGVLDAEAELREVRHMIRDLEPQWAVVTDEHVVGFQKAVGGMSIRGVIIASLTDFASAGRANRIRRMRRRHGLDLGGLRGATGVATTAANGGELFELPPTFSWQAMRKVGVRASHLDPQSGLHRPDQCAAVLYTGGTTGTPHGVMLSDRNLDAVARQLLLQGPILPGQRVLSVVPFSHGLGLSVSVLASVAAAAESVILPHYTSRLVVNTLRRRRPDYLVGVPGFYASLLADRRFHRTRLAFLMGAFSGGDRISSNVLDSFEMTVRRKGGAVGIREGYGLTESVSACVTTPDSTRRAGSVGIPVPDTDIRIVRPDAADLDDLPIGSIGELCVSGPTVMMGYLNDAGPCRILEAEGRRWLRTGDLCRIDDDGFVYFVDRIGRAVQTGGRTIHPGVAETALNTHPEVRQVCVTVGEVDGCPQLTAHVVPIDGDLEQEWMGATLTEWCAQELDESDRPSAFVFVNALPRTRLGVVDYRRVGASASVSRG